MYFLNGLHQKVVFVVVINPSVNRLSIADFLDGAASILISLQRWEGQSSYSGLQSRKKKVGFFPWKVCLSERIFCYATMQLTYSCSCFIT